MEEDVEQEEDETEGRRSWWNNRRRRVGYEEDKWKGGEKEEKDGRTRKNQRGEE